MKEDNLPRSRRDGRWWDNWYQTDSTEWIDLIDQPEHAARARRGLEGLDRFQRAVFAYHNFSRAALQECRGIATPRILELGAGRGRLTERLLYDHPHARVTCSDISRDCVAALQSGSLAHHPRAHFRVLDATAIEAPDCSWDVAIFTTSLHHLEPAGVRNLLMEGTRVASKLVLIDAWRHPALLAIAPVLLATGGWVTMRDGIVSLRKAYSISALRSLTNSCDAPITMRAAFRPPGYLLATAERAY